MASPDGGSPAGPRVLRPSMATRESLELAPTESVWCRGPVVPLYRLPSGEPGFGKFFHDHRYIVAQAKCHTYYQFAKQERARNVYGRILREYKLDYYNVMQNADRTRHLPTLMSTSFAVAWLMTRWSMSVGVEERCSPEYLKGWAMLLEGAATAASDAIQADVLDGVPGISACGAQLEVGAYGIIDMTPLLRFLPDMPDCWDEMASIGSHGMPRFAGSHHILHVLKFFELRIFKTNNLSLEHPIQELRRAVHAVFSFLVEIQLEMDYVDCQARFASNPPPIMDIRGPSGRYRAHHRPLEKVVALKHMQAKPGSMEVTMQAFGQFKGSSAQLRAAKLQLYDERGRDWMAGSHGLAFSLDGSCHGGPSMLCGIVVDAHSDAGRYCRPEATSNYSSECFMGGAGSGSVCRNICQNRARPDSNIGLCSEHPRSSHHRLRKSWVQISSQGHQIHLTTKCFPSQSLAIPRNPSQSLAIPRNPSQALTTKCYTHNFSQPLA